MDKETKKMMDQMDQDTTWSDTHLLNKTLEINEYDRPIKENPDMEKYTKTIKYDNDPVNFLNILTVANWDEEEGRSINFNPVKMNKYSEYIKKQQEIEKKHRENTSGEFVSNLDDEYTKEVLESLKADVK